MYILFSQEIRRPGTPAPAPPLLSPQLSSLFFPQCPPHLRPHTSICFLVICLLEVIKWLCTQLEASPQFSAPSLFLESSRTRGWLISLFLPSEDVPQLVRQVPPGWAGVSRNSLLKKREKTRGWKVFFWKHFSFGQLLQLRFPRQSHRAEFKAPYRFLLWTSSPIGNLSGIWMVWPTERAYLLPSVC